MKKIYTLILAVSSLAATAQTNNDFPTTGSATIYDYSPRLYLKRSSNDGGFIQGIQTQLLDGTNNWFFGAEQEGRWIVSKGDYQNARLSVLDNGNVGIGTVSPTAKLDVNGEIKTDLLSLVEGTTSIGYFGKGGKITSGWNSSPDLLTLNYHARDFAIGGWSKSTNAWMGASLYINSDNGNVGIGTMDPKGYKLAVSGKIRAEEIKVEALPWPDFVFGKDYKLLTLQETEKHIKDKGHLPGIPSEAEVKANGIDLGEMNAKLLQKIEELTLHLIEKDKELKMILQENQSIKSDYQELKKMIVEIKSKKD